MYAFYPTKFKHERRSFFLSISSSFIRTMSFPAVLSGHCHFQQFYQDTVISNSSIRTLSFPAVLSGHCHFQQSSQDTVISSSSISIRTLSFPSVLSLSVISSSPLKTLSCLSVSHFLPFCCLSLRITVWRSNSAVHSAKLECSMAL